MTAITIDLPTGDKLRDVREPVQLRDERGAILGEFRPAPAHGADVTAPDEGPAAMGRLVERMRRATVSAQAFPITREALHERR